MKKFMFLTMAFLIAFGAANVSAQFPVKIPKIGKPKVEKPKTEEPKTGEDNTPSAPNESDANKNQPRKSGGDNLYMPQPSPPNVPVLLKDSLNIRVQTAKKYWKVPAQQFYTSWLPLIDFSLFYDKSETVRYTIEWLKPDGSLWFADAIDGTQSRTSNELFDTKATDAAGVFGFRLLNTKTKAVVLQGKFKVNRVLTDPNDPRYKNVAMFYVEHDGNLPVGYVGFDDHDEWDYEPSPRVYMWFKGDLQSEDFEARLFYNNQQVASTDDGGRIETDAAYANQRNPESCFQQTELCKYSLWGFSWKNFKVASYAREDGKNAYTSGKRDRNIIFTRDKPGEYTVKIFYKSTQVRETKFTIQSNGWLAPNAFAAQIPLDNYKIVVPVKIMGTLDKWNAASWKTDAFYGNPLAGFTAP